VQAHDARETKRILQHRWMRPWGCGGLEPRTIFVHMEPCDREGHAIGRHLSRRCARRLCRGAARTGILSAQVGAGEADRNPLAPSDLELDSAPMAARTPAIDAAAPGPFARLEIGVFVKSFR
jgi:hypothetical protein